MNEADIKKEGPTVRPKQYVRLLKKLISRMKDSGPAILNGILANLPRVSKFEMYYTNNTENVQRDADVVVKDETFKTTIPADCIFTLTSSKNN